MICRYDIFVYILVCTPRLYSIRKRINFFYRLFKAAVSNHILSRYTYKDESTIKFLFIILVKNTLAALRGCSIYIPNGKIIWKKQ